MDNHRKKREDFNWINEKYFGWGDANGRKPLVFIGIEEGSPWVNPQEEIDDLRSRATKLGVVSETKDPSKINMQREKLRRTIAKVCYPLTECDAENAVEYGRKILWRSNSNVINLNLLPLGKKSLSEEHKDLERLFGVTAAEYENARQVRFKIFQDIIGQLDPAFIVCFGVSARKWFEEALDLSFGDHEAWSSLSSAGYRWGSGDTPTILCPHLSGARWRTENLEHLTNLLKANGVSLPGGTAPVLRKAS